MPAAASNVSGHLPPFAGHAWHHYWAGAEALPALAALFFFALAVGTSSRVGPTVRRWRAGRAPSLPLGAGESSPVRASDAEREAVTRQLSAAVGEGRLSLEEGGERIDAALRVRHRHELGSLVADLPPLAPERRRSVLASNPRLGGVALASLVVIAALVQALVGLWELWPVALAACVALSVKRRR